MPSPPPCALRARRKSRKGQRAAVKITATGHCGLLAVLHRWALTGERTQAADAAERSRDVHRPDLSYPDVITRLRPEPPNNSCCLRIISPKAEVLKTSGKEQEERGRIPCPSLKMVLPIKIPKKTNKAYAKKGS